MTRPVLFLAFALTQTGAPVAAQQADRDNGRLVVRRAETVVGEEEFALEVVRDADGGTALSVVVSASYPPGPSRRAIATFGPRRITVRVSSNGSEAGREYPGGARGLVMHDELLGLLAAAGRMAPGPVTLFAPPAGGGRRSGSLEDLGEERLAGPGGPTLRHLALRSDAERVDLWFDPEGRLVRVAIPARQIQADRLSRP